MINGFYKTQSTNRQHFVLAIDYNTDHFCPNVIFATLTVCVFTETRDDCYIFVTNFKCRLFHFFFLNQSTFFFICTALNHIRERLKALCTIRKKEPTELLTRLRFRKHPSQEQQHTSRHSCRTCNIPILSPSPPTALQHASRVEQIIPQPGRSL